MSGSIMAGAVVDGTPVGAGSPAGSSGGVAPAGAGGNSGTSGSVAPQGSGTAGVSGVAPSGSDGTGVAPAQGPEWLNSLPEAFRKDPSLQKFKGPEALAASYLELQKVMGKSVRLPDKPEEWDATFTKMGRPESPDKYSFSKPDLGFGAEIPEEFEAQARARAHAMGLNQVQFDRYVRSELEDAKQEMTEMAEVREEAMATITEMWKANTERNVAMAQRALQFYDPDGELLAVLEHTGLGNHPKVVKMFYDFGLKLQEDQLIPGEVQGIWGADAAKARIAEMTKNEAYTNAMHPDHNRIVAEVEKLYQIAYR